MLGLAGLLLFLRFGNRVHQSLALVFVLQAAYYGVLVIDSRWDSLVGRVRPYLLILLTFALALFGIVYANRYGRLRASRARAAMALLLVATAGALVAYLVNHGLVRTADTYGPFQLFFAFPALVGSLIALLFLREYRRAAPGRRRRSFLLASAAFLWPTTYSATFHFLGPTGDLLYGARQHEGHWVSPWLVAADLLQMFPLIVFGVAGVALLARAKASYRLDERLTVLGGALAGVALGAMTAYLIRHDHSFGLSTVPHRLATSGLQIVSTVLLTYAILKHRLFDAEVQVRWAIKHTTIAALFVTVFFVVSEGAQQIFQESVGPYLGIAAAGLLVFALAPLQHVAERLAARAVPKAGAMRIDPAERRAVYKEQLEIAWADGALTRRERLLFDRLQQRLGLTPAEAQNIERETLERLGPRASSKGRPAR